VEVKINQKEIGFEGLKKIYETGKTTSFERADLRSCS